MNDSRIQKPFLKWVGGKTQILDDIISKIPKKINNYHEPFLGGGSVLFAILCLQQEKKIIITNNIYAYDVNKDLINVYKNITQNENVAKVSIVGAGMVSTPGITYKMFRGLADEKINILAISTSEIKLSVIIDEKNTLNAVKKLHTIFELD